uniref:interferon-induced protein 44-like n=1 Tax=Semicossyphus pulcher TaxID=241346 RepID=UPI0037E78940
MVYQNQKVKVKAVRDSKNSPSQLSPLQCHSVRSSISKAMGGLFSAKPWRTMPESREGNLSFVKSYQPGNKEVKHLRILLHGPVGAGKSSFFNSVDSVLQGRITNRASTDATSGSSHTLQYKTYKIHEDPRKTYPFVFNDIMGFEKQKGVIVEDVKLALSGHVREGYEFKPDKQLMEGDEGYNPSPTLDDRVHVLVCVAPADAVSLLSKEVVMKMREVRLAASRMGIPQLAILTKVDEACAESQSDISNVYKREYTKNQVDKFSGLLGIQPNHIFLVKNYHSESITSDDIDALILFALKQMITSGDDFLNDM